MSQVLSKFLIVSNRLPISVSKTDGKLTFTPSAGGLATAMASLETAPVESRLWIGWPGIAADDLTAGDKRTITRRLKQDGLVPIFLTKAQIKSFYDGYSNDTLWPMFHYFQSYARHQTEHWQAYRQVNQLFARTIAKFADPEATIWVHDYHFMILPKLLRRILPQASVGFFLHIPFPSFELFRLLPNRQELLEGLLGADLIGFHTYDYARHFMSSVLRILGFEHKHGAIMLKDRQVLVDVFPIGIDYDKFVEASDHWLVAAEKDVLHTHYKDQKIILSVDRLDYSKGIAHRLEAFEAFLRQNPRYHKKIVLVVIAVPSRVEVETYKDLRDQIEQTVSHINGKYGTVDWMPISYQFRNLPFEQLVALYNVADIALLTPLRDGMNLVAKEFVASKQHLPGVLILSEMAGAVDELPESLRINPNDQQAIVEALKSALKMPKSEQLQRLKSMQRRLASYTVKRWAKDFLEQLAVSRRDVSWQQNKELSAKTRQQLITDFQRAKRRRLFFDYDGTLRNFVDSPDPKKAKPPKTLLQILKKLSKVPNTDMYIISGRTREALDSWFSSLAINLIAEHGAWIKKDGKWQQTRTSFQTYKAKLLPLLTHYAERTPGAIVEEKTHSIVWHYRNVSPDLAYARGASLRHELHNILQGSDVDIFNGSKIIEIKPKSIHKGAVVAKNHGKDDFILCIGDDYTDEYMFKALPSNAYTIKVGLSETQARFQLGSVEKVLALLKALSL